MISEIANKILSLHLEYKESFDRVSQNVSKEKKVKELHEKIFLLEEKIISLEKTRHKVFLLNLSKRNELSREISNIKNQIIELKKESENIEKTINNFEQEVIDKADLYMLFSRLSNQKSEKDIKKFIEYFKNNLENIINFCKENNIAINFIDEELFLKVMLELKKSETHAKEYKEIESLEDIYLVSKTVVDGIPQNDIYYPSILTKKKKNGTYKVEIKGKQQQINIDHIDYDSYTTKHWAMNQEVLTHSEAPKGWGYCDIIIIHKMTKKMYSQLFHFDPLDTASYGKLNLEDYFIICTSTELADKIKKLNPNCTPIVFPKYLVVRDDDKLTEEEIEKRKEYKNLNIGAGNILLSCLGCAVNYEAYNGIANGRDKCFSDELIEKFPKLNRRGTVTDKTEHEISELIYRLSISHEVINKVIKEYCNDSFEENVAILKEVDKSLDAWTIGRSMSRGHFEELILKKINISENIPKEYQDDAIFLDNVILFLSENYNNLNPNKLFEIIISNLNINGNELAFKKLKVMFINELKSKFDGIIIFDIGNFLDFMLFFRRVASSEKIMYSKVNIDEEINIPIECLDLSEYEKFFESILTDDSFDISNISNQKMLVTKFAKFVKKTPPILDNVILSEQKYIANELYNFLKIISDRKKFNIYKEELLKLGIDENELEFLDRINSIMAQDDIKDGKINERNKRCLLYLVFSYKYIEKKLKKISHVKKEFHK